jgi:hypothetical protein
MEKSPSEIEAEYRARRDAFAEVERRITASDRWLTHARTVAFLVAAALLSIGWMGGNLRPWYVAGGIVLAGFFALVTYHEHLLRQLERHRLLRQINAQSIARLHRDWANLAETTIDIPSQYQSLSHDLDLFGHASLFHLLCTANTPTGRRVLRDWLLEPATPDEIRGRQRAVADLAPHWELRQSLDLEGRLLADRGRTTEQFIDWAAGAPWLLPRPWLLWICRLLPAGLLGTILLTITGAIEVQAGGVAILVLLALNVLVSVLFLANVHDIFARLSTRSGKIRGYLTMFQLMYSMPESMGELDAVKRQATERGGGVLLRLGELSWIVGLASISHSALFFVLVYLPLQLLLLYDFHLLYLVELWQKKYGRYAEDWFQALGKFEALASLAHLAHDHPDWSFPDVREDAAQLAARGLGHPLLPDAARVGNDVSVGPVGTFLLVTGSNMSGKSTLLRSIGVNAVLAEAGAPVCAAELSMPPVVLATSMRIHDSLEFGVSFYMAELMRLKQVVDLAARTQQQGGRRMLYLLDEILQGTNSKERHIAVERVLEHLLRHDAVGAVSTHDLELATSPLLRDACQCVHFRETLHGADAEQPMTFDYRLRPGVATTTNALKLLALVGLRD